MTAPADNAQDRPREGAPRWVLKPVHDATLPPWIDVHPERGLTIGRADDNDVTLAATEHAQVSAHHLRIAVGGETDDVRLFDLGSTNGTFVNGIRVEEKVLKPGDLIALGKSGTRFVVERRKDLSSTAVLQTAEIKPEFGEKTVRLVRAAIGLEGDAGVSEALAARGRRQRRIAVWLTAALVMIGGVVAYVLHDLNSQEIQRLGEYNAELQRDLAKTAQNLEAQRAASEAQREELEAEKAALIERLAKIEAGDVASGATIAELRGKLEITERNLALFDPVNLEKSRLAGVKRVLQSVVFIDTTVRLRDPDSGQFVRYDLDEFGDAVFRLGGEGEPYSRDKTGSGFVVSPEGWILTNAHVIEAPRGLRSGIKIQDGTMVEPHVEVTVLFSGQPERRVARVVAQVHEKGRDFALLHIEPFEGMHYVPSFSIDQPLPAETSEVYLFGYPLGREIVQPGDRVIASTFKGIVSRYAAPFIQVDAAVHPGNSGGPATDANGRILGIVTAVARMPEGGITPSIGYVIPISAVSDVWPPPAAASSVPTESPAAGSESAPGGPSRDATK